MLKMGVPPQAVKQKMIKDGVDPAILDMELDWRAAASPRRKPRRVAGATRRQHRVWPLHPPFAGTGKRPHSRVHHSRRPQAPRKAPVGFSSCNPVLLGPVWLTQMGLTRGDTAGPHPPRGSHPPQARFSPHDPCEGRGRRTRCYAPVFRACFSGVPRLTYTQRHRWQEHDMSGLMVVLRYL